MELGKKTERSRFCLPCTISAPVFREYCQTEELPQKTNEKNPLVKSPKN
jgi:hypothetical protein